jgi:hypothetical protein
VLIELAVVEQRYLAVREVLDTGSSIVDATTRCAGPSASVCRCVGITVPSGQPSRCRPLTPCNS